VNVVDKKALKHGMFSLGFIDISDNDRMRFSIPAHLGSSHNIEIRVQRHPQGWWQCTLIDSWETTLLDQVLLEGLELVRSFTNGDWRGDE